MNAPDGFLRLRSDSWAPPVILDAAQLLAAPPPKIEWLVEGLIPLGCTMDLFGPPGAGKTTLLTDLCLAVAAESGQWHGRDCIGGQVVILGGERTDRAALARDLHRSGRPAPDPGALRIPADSDGDCPPIWRWDRRACGGAGQWALTEWGERTTAWLVAQRPALIVLDTIISVAQGCDLLDQPQQYALGQTVRRWTKSIGSTSIGASHTNQASASGELRDRLDYISRAGGNGFPGALRHIAGVTKLRGGEIEGLDPALDGTLFAVGVSKHNESPPTSWTHHTPAIFSQRAGRVEMVMDSQEVRERLRIDACFAQKRKKNGAI
ncbi:MAG: AAA family ATPase [Betaproteobacteria bacterium]|nr:AAA family ATPase [Betaproteobacteria bacterium]